MPAQFRLIDGAGFAAEASALLSSAWPEPALRYPPEYLEWQFSFPGPFAAPAVAAFCDSRPVGFAATTNRRVRYRSALVDAALVSFVAVHPEYRNQGIASGLYRLLLSAIGKLGAPVLTFAQTGTGGVRAIERAYPEAGFSLEPLGSYPVYGCLTKPATSVEGWVAIDRPEQGDLLRRAVAACGAENGMIWSDPSHEQLKHYGRDPRRRTLLVNRREDGGIAGAAWIVEVEYAARGGVDRVTTIECVWLPRDRPGLLPSLAAAAARAWPQTDPSPPQVVHAPSLFGFEAQALRQSGFRHVSSQFQCYAATSSRASRPFTGAAGGNLEVV